MDIKERNVNNEKCYMPWLAVDVDLILVALVILG
jgi:hypothetical protein